MALASRFRTVSLILATAALSSSVACSLILNPRDDVQRCGNVDDCETPEDSRYEAVCISDPDADIDTTQVEQVCVAQFRDVRCNPDDDPTGELAALVDSRSSLDYACPAASDPPVPGVQGCPPEDGCAAGLEVIDGVCDDPRAEVPSIRLTSVDNLRAQDVKDQFCRGFFCDEEYVCNSTPGITACEKCDPSKPFGEGGCGTVYTQGTPSCVYSSECAAPDSDVNEPIFGDCG